MFTIDTLKSTVRSLGYANIKDISGKTIAVLTNDNRIDVLEKINKKIPGSTYDRKPTSQSSVGRLLVSGFTVFAKPASKQGSASAGIENELIVVNSINKAVKDLKGPINVCFKAKNKDWKNIKNLCKDALIWQSKVWEILIQTLLLDPLLLIIKK